MTLRSRLPVIAAGRCEEALCLLRVFQRGADEANSASLSPARGDCFVAQPAHRNENRRGWLKSPGSGSDPSASRGGQIAGPTSEGRGLRWPRDAAVIGVYLFLALLLTYPLVLHLNTHVPGRGVDDPALTWNLWWVKYSVFNLGTSPLYTDYLYYPLGVNLVAYTSTFLNGVLSLPLQFVFGVILANNLIIYFALVSGGYGAYLLACEVLARGEAGLDKERDPSTKDTKGHEVKRQIPGDQPTDLGSMAPTRARPFLRDHSVLRGCIPPLAAALAGAFYAFGAWHINYVAAGHMMLLSSEWIPFLALFLLRLSKRSWRAGGLAGLFFVLAAWTELTFIPFLAILTGLYLVYWVIVQRCELNRQFALGLAALGLVGGLGVSPLFVNLLLDFQRYGYYLAPGLARVQIFSAEPVSFFIPSAAHPLLGDWANRLTNANTAYAFVGYAALALAVLGTWVGWVRREARFWAVAALFFALVLLGPTLIIGGEPTGIPLPFALLRAVPFVNANRYPVRFNTMLMLSLVPLLALGAAALMRTARRRAVAGTLAALLLFEQLAAPVPLTDLRAPAVFETMRAEPGDWTVLDLPLGWRNSVSIQGAIDYKAQFFQAVHQKRLIGGLTSRNPACKFQYFLELPVINSLITLETGGNIDEGRRAADRETAPDILRFFDIRYIEVQRALTSARVLDYVLDVFPLREVYRDDERLVYRVVQTPPPLAAVDLNAESARLYFDEGWGRAQALPEGTGYRWAGRGDARLWLPLARTDRQVRFRLLAPRAEQRVSVRVNGESAAEWVLTTEWKEYILHLPPAAVRAGLNEIAFSNETVPVGATRQGDYAVGQTGVVSPVDLVATSAGFDAGRFGEIFVDGRNIIPNERGYHLVAVNPQTGRVERTGVFDTFADPGESTRLAQFVDTLPAGEIVVGVAVDEVSKQLQQVAVDALRRLGVDGDVRFSFRADHAFIGVKGAWPGQALEKLDGRWPANVAVGKNIGGDRAAFAMAGIWIER